MRLGIRSAIAIAAIGVVALSASLSVGKPQQVQGKEIKATSPTRGYTRRYGSETGPWTTNDFVEAVYRSLVQKGQ